MPAADIVIAGAGVIGLSLALELRSRGLTVILLEAGIAGAQASSAAAGMLAAHDPANPAQLTGLAALSLAHYPALLQRVLSLTGVTVPFETERTLEVPTTSPGAENFHDLSKGAALYPLRAEQSLDPRKLLTALVPAARAAGVDLREGAPLLHITETATGVFAETAHERFTAACSIDCSGAWSGTRSGPWTRPAKGQMLRLTCPPGLLRLAEHGNVVVRTPEVYLVPRLNGTVVIGATVEDAGFDTGTNEQDMRDLRSRAAALFPSLATVAEQERWAGLRPRTPDDLPLLGPVGKHCYVAAGHFRNGILLAPGTAVAMAELVLGKASSLDLTPFAPSRFSPDAPSPPPPRDDKRTNDRL